MVSSIRGAEEAEGAEKADEKNEKKAFSGVAQRLFDSRQITLFGAVDDEMALKISAQLLALEQADPTAPITMILNSPGGSVSDGFAIYDTMRFIQPEVRVVCTGLAASIATVILMGAPKEHRFVRADRFSDEDAAADHAIMKGQQIVDQLGERIFS